MEQVKGRVLVHSLIFPPDQVSTSYLYGDIAKALILSGYEVDVITTYPHYNYDLNFKKQSKPGFLCRMTEFEGARVFHAKQRKSGSVVSRGFYILWFHFFFLYKALTIKKFDLVISPSPPLTAGLLSGIVAKLRGAKSVYNVQEIYPDVLVKQGGFKWRPILRFLSIIEKHTYALSTKVVTIDSHFSDVISPRLAREKLECIPNFIDTELYSPYQGIESSELNFEGKFLVGYVGNLGKVQDWDTLFETALLFQKNPKIAFLIVGGGSEFERLKSFEQKLNNWTVWSYQPRDKVPEINSRIDIHIISMNEASDYDGLPSKVFAILSSGRPILAATNKDTPLSKLILRSGNGLVVERSNPQAIAKGIELSLQGFFNEKKSRVGRDFVVNNFSKEVITKQYVDLLDSLLLTD